MLVTARWLTTKDRIFFLNSSLNSHFSGRNCHIACSVGIYKLTIASTCLIFKTIPFCKWKQHVDLFYMNSR
ncbi:hypothetical protein F0562_026526 [Nyssa sinensis]|uniref:Uncharacterized protein n=1 Tax=Nyssa sinensis TaxID=561372 RepID=A0A5J5BB12_9ASTE|nr:hypothetical protein F0562_026526 [Nyssa sinensis]